MGANTQQNGFNYTPIELGYDVSNIANLPYSTNQVPNNVSQGYNYNNPVNYPAIPNINPSTAQKQDSNYWLGNGTAKDPGALMMGLNTLSGLTQAYTGYKSLDLGRDQFNLAQSQYNRDLLNQGGAYNTQLENAYGSSLRSSGKYDINTQEGLDAFNADLANYVERNRVDTSAIKV